MDQRDQRGHLVATKVRDSETDVVLRAEPFLSKIRVTAKLQPGTACYVDVSYRPVFVKMTIAPAECPVPKRLVASRASR